MFNRLPAASSRSRLACLGLLPAASLLALSCSDEVASPDVVTAPPVMVVPVELRDVRDRIEATGELLAKSRASVAAQVGGQVTGIRVDEGTAVERGDVILEIDPELRQLEYSNQEARVAEAEAQVAESRREKKRVDRLRENGAVSQAAVEDAATQLKLSTSRLAGARAQLGLARRALSDSTIVAPFAGRVDRRFVSEGEFVQPGMNLFELVALEDMEVEFFLSERDSSLVEEGDSVDVRVAPFPKEVFRGTVRVISPTIDSNSRTLRVKAAVDNEDGRLRPGLFARADLGVSERSGVAMVPEDAIVLRSDGSVVFRLVGGNEVERVRVTTGVYRDGWVEVAEGLASDDVVVVRGQARLVDGSVVEVRTADGGRPTSFSASAHDAQAAR